MAKPFEFHQLFEAETSTYTYLIGDPESGQALLIDPVLEKVERDLRLIDELGFSLSLVLDTHIHADHVTGAGELRRLTGAQTGVCRDANVDCADLVLKGDDKLQVGSIAIKVLATPGHTDSCLSFLIGPWVFTGDALLIRANGRTDFQQGSAEKLYNSIMTQLYTLPDETLVFPGHDYKGFTRSSIGMEKRFNSRIPADCTLEDFVARMSQLKLAPPRNIQAAVPANLSCGQTRNPSRPLAKKA